MQKEYITTKLYRTTLKNLKLLAALRGEHFNDILDKMVRDATAKAFKKHVREQRRERGRTL